MSTPNWQSGRPCTLSRCSYGEVRLCIATKLNDAALMMLEDESAGLDSHPCLAQRFFPEVDSADPSPGGGSGGNSEHGFGVGEAGPWLMSSSRRKTSRLSKQTYMQYVLFFVI